MDNETSNISAASKYESLDHLNARYSKALLPLTIFLAILAVIGVVGNIIVILVFSIGREYKNSNFKIFVLCLAVVDLITCVSLIPAEIAKHFHYFSLESEANCKIKCYFNVFGSGSAALTLTLISIDRFRKVYQPMKKQIWPALALKLCMGCILFSIILSWPAAQMCGIESGPMKNIYGGRTVVYLCGAEKKYQKSVWRDVYKYVLFMLQGGVSIVCIFMYIMIGRVIVKNWGDHNVGNTLKFDSSSRSFDSSVKESIVNEVILGPEDVKTSSGGVQIETEQQQEQQPKKTLRKQSSVFSNFSSTSRRLSSNDEAAKRRMFNRQTSGFGFRQFPYKTLIWFILTVIFIITYIIYCGLSINVAMVFTLSPRGFALFAFFFRLYFLNNVANPIIYAFLDIRFRRSCKKIFAMAKHCEFCRRES
ncbi:hypothetical protein CHS0354_008280 [Potamilus streckersoni]|uniref:G-protein coupled receptors family 1 profile domain-containing protein n=1 Tax=Potamilus streckersoni TaxID=2493646 RepID=A0AAE0VWA2_9BIVA|nr:hypothetical protein CHS0354_008280 [Potamilus streckersoni]